MVDESRDVIAFATPDDLWNWLGENAGTHPGVWVRLAKAHSGVTSVTFHELLEAGIAFGWSESTRRAGDSETYLQRFTPRRVRGTASARNLAIAARLEREGRMTASGRAALASPLPSGHER